MFLSFLIDVCLSQNGNYYEMKPSPQTCQRFRKTQLGGSCAYYKLFSVGYFVEMTLKLTL